MHDRRSRIFQSLLLALVGLFLLERVWSGKILFYINQRFVILVVLAGIGLIALAQAVFLEHGPKEDDPVESDGAAHEPTGHPDSHSHPGKTQLIWLLIPLVIGLLVPVRSLGVNGLANRGIQVTAPFQVQNTTGVAALELPAGNRTVLDWIRAFRESGDPRTLANQPVDVTGFVYHDPRLQPGQFLLARYTVACCIADATAIGVTVNWEGSTRLENSTWVRVKGSIQVGELDGKTVPLIQAEQVTPVPEPNQPYLFP